MQTSIATLDAHIDQIGVIESCKTRIQFLVNIAVEAPEVIKKPYIFSGFIESLLDIEQMLRLAEERNEQRAETILSSIRINGGDHE